MKPFDYIPVATIAEACSLLSEHGPDASVLAGGTDLLIKLRHPSTKPPKVLLDTSRANELGGIIESDGGILIRPLTTHSQLLRSNVLRTFAPCLVSAASTIGSPQIRNRGTIGGNIMNAATCADTVPPLIALGAIVTLQSKTGRRELDLAELFLKPYQTRAKPDELLTAVRFSKLPANARSAFIKLGRRNALSTSRLSVAAILQMNDDGRIGDARIVPGSVFPVWKRVTDAEAMLVGEKPAVKLFAAAGKKVAGQMIKEAGRRWSSEYKEPVIAVLVRRALEQAAVAHPALRDKPAVPQTSRSAVPPISKSATPEHVERLAGLETSNTADLEVCATITTTINGRSHTLAIPAHWTLLDLLRDRLGFTGTKSGCEIGECGACTVLLDGEPVNSCLVLAPQIAGRHVLTVEGLMQRGKLHLLQESFMDCDAVHCGFCTPGMLMSAKALLDLNPHPTETQIRTAISGNLCRCTGYQQIVDAIAAAAKPERTKVSAKASSNP
ncbi:MAG: FAD binding domain-containing protein [Limisphaerales bacterium]